MDDIKRDKNINITFIDEIADIDEYGYQKNDISQLEGKFDYIFPINCPFPYTDEILNLLKPSGKYLYNDYRVDIMHNEIYKKQFPDPQSKEANAAVENVRKKMIKDSSEIPRINGTMIEFNEYIKTREPYVYKSDITTGAGFFIIYTRNDLPNKDAAIDDPHTPPTGKGENKNTKNKKNKNTKNKKNKNTKNKKNKRSKRNKYKNKYNKSKKRKKLNSC